MFGENTIKAKLIPIFFKSGNEDEFNNQLNTLRNLLVEDAEILEPIILSSTIPGADAVIFPQLLGDAFKQIDDLKKIKLPFLIATSEFGTVNMWDWEIITYMKSEGIKIFSPYTINLTKKICRSLGLKREMKKTKFIVFQDNPGDGMQASIFKRFYWWEKECTDLIKKKFGIEIIKNSFKRLGEEAKKISDKETQEVRKKWNLKSEDVTDDSINSAIKLYIAIKKKIEKDDCIRSAGINCLNESFYSDTTPCLAWNMLFKEKNIIWGCEADTLTMLTMYIIYNSLDAPVMMSNIYPFLMGQAAIKHEKITKFPDVLEPENHLLVVHCGYFGVIPEAFSEEWILRPKVLEIVEKNATAIDARLPKGNVTLVKLHPKLNKLMVVEGKLEGYVQYPKSDCRNGAIIKIKNGYKLMNKFYSHHNCIMVGHKSIEIENLANVLDLEVDYL